MYFYTNRRNFFRLPRLDNFHIEISDNDGLSRYLCLMLNDVAVERSKSYRSMRTFVSSYISVDAARIVPPFILPRSFIRL